jgi:hypothetical protein
MARLAHHELAERIKALSPGARARIQEKTPSWPMNAGDYDGVDALVAIEEEAASMPEAPSASSSVGPEVDPPAREAGSIGPSGPTPLRDRPISWLRDEVDRLHVEADRRSRQSMIDALADYEARQAAELFGEEPF